MAVVASVLVIGQRNPMYSVAAAHRVVRRAVGLYVLLGAPFVAVAQIIIYAGAIMVLFLFVVMLLNVPTEDPPSGTARTRCGAGPRASAPCWPLLLVVQLAWALRQCSESTRRSRAPRAAPSTSVREIGLELFTDYAFAFEATSVLILVAMVGAIVLARREGRPSDPAEPLTRI